MYICLQELGDFGDTVEHVLQNYTVRHPNI